MFCSKYHHIMYRYSVTIVTETVWAYNIIGGLRCKIKMNYIKILIRSEYKVYYNNKYNSEVINWFSVSLP